MKENRIRQACRLALVTALLPFAVGSSAQSAMHWKGAVSRAPQPATSATGLPNPLPATDTQLADGFDVRRFEAVANQLVANGRIPGLAMAIVKDGRILSARGYGITDARNPQPVDAHTVFRLASLSKSFAGTVTGMLVNDGVSLTKLWFSVTASEQRTRFTIRQVDPVRQWKLSPTDLASLDKWDDYTAAKEDMFAWTDTEAAPWTVVKSNDKKRARINAMRHVLSKFDYDNKDHEVVGRPDPLIVGRALSD